MLDQLGDPDGVGDVGLAAGDVAQVAGVEEPAFDVVLEEVEDRLPVDPGRLHPDQGHPMSDQPVAQGQQVPGRGPELMALGLPLSVRPRHPNAGDARGLVHVEAGAPLDHGVHRSSLLPARR